ncbi:ribonuclease HII [Candidatus Hecatella orcuttiae]|jgi:ribonuclease HII|uniref:ribonuclease HII n=1 Tax=Candidatus Hecatella orcuttiae TaxID=1935119 RepID=UPI0028682641|nr:ribonuclease HII [Candidatus Hecatella orcuttiae]
MVSGGDTPTEKILGVDEAGRGPVIGPMIVCGVVATEESIRRLEELGVKDSKELTRQKRVELKSKIMKTIQGFHMVEVYPREIDEAVRRGKLNVLEARKMAEIMERFNPDVTYIDAPASAPENFLNVLKNFLKTHRGKIIAENFADKKYPIVSAASILAKVRRDMIMEEYCKKYGPMGSGYPSDEVTISFLEKYFRKHKKFPEIVRLEWETRREILEKITQSKLSRFF